jgi:hypothetical protein
MPGVLTRAVKDPLLVQAQRDAEASVPAQYKRGYNATMAAGLKLMFSEQTFPDMKKYVSTIKGPQDIPKVIAHGIVKLMSILFNETKGKVPLETSISAAIVLMTHALQYLEDVMKMQIDEATLAETTRLTNQGMLLLLKQASNLSDDQFQQIMAGKGKALAAQLRSQPPAPSPQAGAGAMPPTTPTAPVGGM